MSQRRTFKVSEIQPNPFRKIDSYPFHPEKIETLRESIRNTGFWDNVVARINEDGEPEIAYGHHRMEAVKKELGPDAEVELILRDLSDDDMLRIMARENMEEWGTSVWVEMETVKSAVEAYAEGRIHLPQVPENVPDAQRRYAPGFAKGSADGDDDRAYTATSLAKFLGWTQRDRGRVRESGAVEIALAALEMVEAGVLDEDDLRGLTREAAKEAIRGARRVKRRKEEAAKFHEQQAEEAERQADEAEDEKTRKSARRRSQASRRKAKKLRREGAEAEKKAAKTVTSKLKSGKIGTKQARSEADKVAGRKDEAEKIVYAQKVAQQISKSIHRLLSSQHHDLAEKVEEMIRLRDMLDESDREEIAKNLDALAERATVYAEQMREPVEEGEELTGDERQELITA